METQIVTSVAFEMLKLPSGSLPGKRFVNILGFGVKMSCIPYWSRKEIPMAVISSEMRGELRSGL